MESTLVAEFDTRRAAELAVEHVVQECCVSRSDVFVQPTGGDNTHPATGRQAPTRRRPRSRSRAASSKVGLKSPSTSTARTQSRLKTR